ncbi:hypothetical protein MAUB1S_00901 [Mycolicibacterium aubagnense]
MLADGVSGRDADGLEAGVVTVVVGVFVVAGLSPSLAPHPVATGSAAIRPGVLELCVFLTAVLTGLAIITNGRFGWPDLAGDTVDDQA